MLEWRILETTESDNQCSAKWQLLDGNPIVTVTETIAKKEAVLSLDGRLRGDTLHPVRDELMLLMLQDMDITLDCTRLVYIGNNCKTALIEVQQMMDKHGVGSLILKKVPHDIYNEFKMQGLTGALDIEVS